MYVSVLHSGVKKFGMISLAILVFTMPGMSAKRSQGAVRPLQASLPAVIESAGATSAHISGTPQSGSAVRTSSRESFFPAGFSKSVTIIAALLFFMPFAASSYHILRRHRAI